MPIYRRHISAHRGGRDFFGPGSTATPVFLAQAVQSRIKNELLVDVITVHSNSSRAQVRRFAVHIIPSESKRYGITAGANVLRFSIFFFSVLSTGLKIKSTQKKKYSRLAHVFTVFTSGPRATRRNAPRFYSGIGIHTHTHANLR